MYSAWRSIQSEKYNLHCKLLTDMHPLFCLCILQFTGQCQCRPKFGGRTCCDCEELHYGDPLVECRRCDCDPDGSESLQCSRDGQCPCRTGITGRRCDMCARGTTGELPYCEPCGECFDNWDAIIMDLYSKNLKCLNFL